MKYLAILAMILLPACETCDCIFGEDCGPTSGGGIDMTQIVVVGGDLDTGGATTNTGDDSTGVLAVSWHFVPEPPAVTSGIVIDSFAGTPPLEAWRGDTLIRGDLGPGDGVNMLDCTSCSLTLRDGAGRTETIGPREWT